MNILGALCKIQIILETETKFFSYQILIQKLFTLTNKEWGVLKACSVHYIWTIQKLKKSFGKFFTGTDLISPKEELIFSKKTICLKNDAINMSHDQ